MKCILTWMKTMALNRCVSDLETMRGLLHHYYNDVTPSLTADLLQYAEELDAAYKDIKISKVAGQSGCVVGGVLAIVGFGLSFVTFGASLGLCIAGGVIGGAGAITTGGASIADFVKAKQARKKTEDRLAACNREFRIVLEKCEQISDELSQIGAIEQTFPAWFMFWKKLFFGSGQLAAGFGWSMVANTIISAVRLTKGIDVASDFSTASVSVFRSLGNAMKGLHIAGGVFSAALLPLDVYFLISNSVELHKNEAHIVSTKIRDVVADIQRESPSVYEINKMIDSCIAALDN